MIMGFDESVVCWTKLLHVHLNILKVQTIFC